MTEFLVYGSRSERSLERPAAAAVTWEFIARAGKLAEARILARYFGADRGFFAVRVFKQGAALGRCVHEEAI